MSMPTPTRWARPKLVRPPGFILPCGPTLAANVPTGAGWLHELKHDGFRSLITRMACGYIFGRARAEAVSPLCARARLRPRLTGIIILEGTSRRVGVPGMTRIRAVRRAQGAGSRAGEARDGTIGRVQPAPATVTAQAWRKIASRAASG